MASRKNRSAAAAEASDEPEDEDSEPEAELIFTNTDPFGATTDANQGQAAQTAGGPAHNFVHLHFQKRNARQCLTSVRGLPEDLDMKKLTRHFKKAWCCNGTTTKHSEWGDIIQLQGDHRRDIFKFLIDEGISTKEEIKIHGY